MATWSSELGYQRGQREVLGSLAAMVRAGFTGVRRTCGGIRALEHCHLTTLAQPWRLLAQELHLHLAIPVAAVPQAPVCGEG